MWDVGPEISYRFPLIVHYLKAWTVDRRSWIAGTHCQDMYCEPLSTLNDTTALSIAPEGYGFYAWVRLSHARTDPAWQTPPAMVICKARITK